MSDAAATASGGRALARRFWRHRAGRLGLFALFVLVVASAGAPWLAPRDPTATSIFDKLQPPGRRGYLLGSDELGRDLASRLMFAGRVSLGVGVIAGAIVILIGGAVGLVAGFSGGRVDAALMRVTDIALSFPTTFLLLAVAALVRQTSIVSIGVIIGATAWMDAARLVRGEVLSLRERDFVTAAIGLGASTPRLLLLHLLPNVLAVMIVAGTLEVARAVLLESTLSYLGFGIQPPDASWGNMLTSAQGAIATAPWLGLLPGLMITVAVTSVNFVGDALRDALDPQLDIDPGRAA